MSLPDLGDYQLTRFLVRRGVALVYLIAFLVAANQFRPLLGENGLLPAPRFLEGRSFWQSPSLFHLTGYSDRIASLFAWTGVMLSAAAVLGLPASWGTLPSMAVWLLLWVLYLSFVNVGQVFYGFGWESQLLETGVLMIFLGGAGTATPDAVVWLLRWLLFRIMLGAALIKLRGDRCWRELTCLKWHYETQPMPNPVSWWAHQMPVWMHKAGVAFTHFVQGLVPFFYFVPGPVSWTAGGLTVLFQLSLIVTGNFSWLNVLTLVTAFACFSDPAVAAVLPLDPGVAAARPLPFDLAVAALVALVVVLSIRPVENLLSSRQRMNTSFDPFRLVNTYGAFGSITKARREVVLEGTLQTGPDADWQEYEFKGKPGDPQRLPPQVAPYHLRLDWQMWFAAMSPPHHHPWILRLVEKLLEADEEVLALLSDDPFDGERPAQVRAQWYRYEFTDPDERRATGRWWRRSLLGIYLPPTDREAVQEGRIRSIH